MTDSAKNWYIDENNKRKYLSKYKHGKNKIDQQLEIKLLNEISSDLVGRNAKVLEIGVFAGRMNNLLKKIWEDITVTEINSDLLKSYKKSFVLDLQSEPINVSQFYNTFDLCVSLGHQLSFSCSIENSFKFISKTLKPNGIFLVDIWNKGCHKKFDPSFRIAKSNYADIVQIAQKNGLKLVRFYYGQKLFYLAPRLSIILGRLMGELFYGFIYFFEEKLFSETNIKFPTQNLYFVFQKCV